MLNRPTTPEEVHALINKVGNLSALVLSHEMLIDKYVLDAAKKVLGVAEKVVKTTKESDEIFAEKYAANDTAEIVIGLAKGQEEALEKLRDDLVKTADYSYLKDPLNRPDFEELEKHIIKKCREYGKSLLDELWVADNGIADALRAKNPILQKYSGETTDKEFVDSFLAWRKVNPS